MVTAEKLNTWLTLFANLGVMLGLILLVWEINQNTEMMKAQMSHSRSETAQSASEFISNSDYLPAILAKVENDAELSREEAIRYGAWFRSFHRNQDNVLGQYRQGFLEENIPRSVRNAVRATVGAGSLSKDSWARSKGMYTDEYVAFVDEVVADLL